MLNHNRRITLRPTRIWKYSFFFFFIENHIYYCFLLFIYLFYDGVYWFVLRTRRRDCTTCVWLECTDWTDFREFVTYARRTCADWRRTASSYRWVCGDDGDASSHSTDHIVVASSNARNNVVPHLSHSIVASIGATSTTAWSRTNHGAASKVPFTIQTLLGIGAYPA